MMLGKDTFENIKFRNDYPFNVTNRGLSETFPEHWHYYAELLIVLQDRVEYSINNVYYSLHQNDLLLVHPGELHALTYNREAASSYIVIQLDASFIYSLPDFKRHQYWIKNFHYLSFQECPELSNHIIQLAFEINHLYYNDILYKDGRIYSKLLEMFVLIGEYVISDEYILRRMNHNTWNLSDDCVKTAHQSELTQKMIDVCSYLSQNCTQEITLSNAASYAGFSKYYFSRLFSEFTGSAFVEFLTNERLKKSMELLLNENLSITDVAMMSGFTSISTFNRAFQKYKHDQPSNFRKQYSLMKSLT